DRAVEFGKLAMAATGDATPYIDARISRGEALFGSDQKASLAEFEEVVQAIPGHGLENTELHLTALIGLSVLAFAVEPTDMERHVGLSEDVIRLSRTVDGPDSGWYANALANQIPVFVEAGDHERAGQVAFEAVALADRIYKGPHSTKATVYCAAGVSLRGRARIAESLEYYSVADAINAGLPHSPLSVESCFRMSGHAHLSQGQLHAALEKLDHSWKIHERHGRQTSRHGYATCGMQASAHLRLGAMDAARRTLDACPANDKALESLQRTQAQAELHFMRAEFEEAGKLAAALRERHPPVSRRGIWMRPWMLSLLLAHN